MLSEVRSVRVVSGFREVAGLPGALELLIKEVDCSDRDIGPLHQYILHNFMDKDEPLVLFVRKLTDAEVNHRLRLPVIPACRVPLLLVGDGLNVEDHFAIRIKPIR